MTVDTLTGKGRGILLRLPHFHDPEGAGPLLLDVVGTAGRALERAEADLYRVLRAHHVETADNEAAEGYTAPLERRGDLDRIFALYLEQLGGTSQLVKVSPALTARSLDARALARRFARPDADSLHAWLWARFSESTRGLLARWQAANARFRADEITAGTALAVLVAGSGTLEAYLRSRLRPATRELLDQYDGGSSLPAGLPEAVARDFDARVLTDPNLYPHHAALFDLLPLPEAARRLRGGIHRDLLRARADAAADPAERQRWEGELAWAERVPTPPGDDLARLNRMLLEAAWPRGEGDGDALPPAGEARPWGLEARGIPPLSQVRDALVDELNAALGDERMAREELHPELEPGEMEAIRGRFGGRLEWVNRVLLERAMGGAVEVSYAPYRERLMALIQVLRRGASTRRGIVDVVAANLGILGDDPEARAARELIQVVEYAPRHLTFFAGDLDFWGEVAVENPNRTAADAEFRFTMRAADYRELANVRLTEIGSGESVEWPGRMRGGDRLVLRGGAVLLNGIAPPEALARPVPPLPPGRSRWRFDADVVVHGREAAQDREWPIGRFDAEAGEAAIFDESVLAPSYPSGRVEVISEAYEPGTFTVSIPWNIPGFTDKFEAADHPRQQIRALVDRVKAAGVVARVAYHERFREEHAIDDALRLIIAGRLLREVHDMVESPPRMFSRQGAAEDHGAQDSLVLTGVFDHTRFDSLNGFA